MTESYSRRLIRFVLVNYVDLSAGCSPRVLEEMKIFTKVRGTKSPQITLTIWKADIDMAISSLSKSDVWGLISLSITPSMLQQVGRHPQLSAWQRRIVNGCIIESCAGCGGKFAPGYCENWFIIKKMRDFLNGARFSDTDVLRKT